MLVIIADASLELVPKELQKEHVVQLSARKRDKHPNDLLLDSSLHWQAMKSLREKEKRGRPDVVHDLLKLALDSQLCQDGKLSVIIHTYNNEVIRINPETRIPRNYNQFTGLIEQLYEKKKLTTKEGKALIEITNEKIEKILNKQKALVLEFGGAKLKIKQLIEKIEKEKPGVIIIGGFPSGELSSVYSKYEKITLFDRETTSSEVLSVLLTCLEINQEY